MAAGTYFENMQAQPATLHAVADSYRTGEGAERLARAADLLRGRRLTSTGMGASLFALLATRGALDVAAGDNAIEETGYLSEHPEALGRPLDSLLVISQSGETIEARKLLAQPGVADVPTVVVTRNPGSSLGEQADIVLPLYSEPDLSVAVQTYTSSVAVLSFLAAQLDGGGTATLIDELHNCADSVGTLLGKLEAEIGAACAELVDAGQIYALGRGNSLASALGTGLLFKEGAKRDCEGSSTAQFRHGAVEVVDQSTAAIVFASSDGEKGQLDQNFIGEMLKYGSRVVVVCDEDFPSISDDVVTLRVPVSTGLSRSILEIVPMQLMAYHLAKHNNVLAGEFRNTVPVIVSA
jgi:glucosamine--fructose-6-phosphate aminotransferase (isomerizing)